MARIFISYAHEEEIFVRKLADYLKLARQKPWFDEYLIAGDEWVKKIDEEIRACEVFIYILTPESLESEYCHWEFGLALQYGKRITPLRLRDTNIPAWIQNYQYTHVIDELTPNTIADLEASATQAKKNQQRKFIGRVLVVALLVIFVLLPLFGAAVGLLILSPAARTSFLVSINLMIPTSTPSLTPSQTPTSTYTSTPTLTSTPTPTSTPTALPTVTYTPIPEPEIRAATLFVVDISKDMLKDLAGKTRYEVVQNAVDQYIDSPGTSLRQNWIGLRLAGGGTGQDCEKTELVFEGVEIDPATARSYLSPLPTALATLVGNSGAISAIDKSFEDLATLQATAHPIQENQALVPVVIILLGSSSLSPCGGELLPKLQVALERYEEFGIAAAACTFILDDSPLARDLVNQIRALDIDGDYKCVFSGEEEPKILDHINAFMVEQVGAAKTPILATLAFRHTERATLLANEYATASAPPPTPTTVAPTHTPTPFGPTDTPTAIPSDAVNEGPIPTTPPTQDFIAEPTPTNTPIPPPTATATRTPTLTFTPVPTNTFTPTPTLTFTPVPTSTFTPIPPPVVNIVSPPEGVVTSPVYLQFTVSGVIPDGYKPVAVVRDPRVRFWAWVHASTSDNVNWGLPGVELILDGGLPCPQQFAIVVVVTNQNVPAGEIGGLPAGIGVNDVIYVSIQCPPTPIPTNTPIPPTPQIEITVSNMGTFGSGPQGGCLAWVNGQVLNPPPGFSGNIEIWAENAAVTNQDGNIPYVQNFGHWVTLGGQTYEFREHTVWVKIPGIGESNRVEHLECVGVPTPTP